MPDPAFEVTKARIGDVVVKRVGRDWHVYRIGPVTVVESLDEALQLARAAATSDAPPLEGVQQPSPRTTLGF